MADDLKVTDPEEQAPAVAPQAGEGGEVNADYQKVEFHLLLEKGSSLPYRYKLITFPQFHEDWLLIKEWVDMQCLAQGKTVMAPKQDLIKKPTPGIMNSLRNSPAMRRILR